MNGSRVDLLERARRALPDVPGVTVTVHGRCRLAGAGLPRLPLTLRSEDECLTLECAPGRGAGSLSPWDALLLNGRLHGNARLTLASGATGIEVRSDIACCDGIDLPTRLSAACDDLREAVLLCRGGVPRTPQPGNQSADGQALSELLGEAGWSFVRRSSDCLAVDLRVRGQSVQALVERVASGFGVRTALGSFPLLSSVSRTAIGVLLLAVSGGIRHVRGGAREDRGSAEVFINASLGAAPALEDVHHVLSAMSVAARFGVRETRGCSDERVAAAYLEARGWDGQSTRSQSQGG